jgi:hypothetical protein
MTLGAAPSLSSLPAKVVPIAPSGYVLSICKVQFRSRITLHGNFNDELRRSSDDLLPPAASLTTVKP